MRRRDFIRYLGLGSVAVTIPEAMHAVPAAATTLCSDKKTKPISGSWFEFQHSAAEGGIGMKHWPILLPTNGAGRCLKSVRSVWSIWF